MPFMLACRRERQLDLVELGASLLYIVASLGQLGLHNETLSKRGRERQRQRGEERERNRQRKESGFIFEKIQVARSLESPPSQVYTWETVYAQEKPSLRRRQMPCKMT